MFTTRAWLALTALVSLVVLAWMTRYEIQPMGGLRIGIYRLDRWTGQVVGCFVDPARELGAVTGPFKLDC